MLTDEQRAAFARYYAERKWRKRDTQADKVRYLKASATHGMCFLLGSEKYRAYCTQMETLASLWLAEIERP